MFPKNIQEYSDIKFNFLKISLANIVYFNGGGSEICIINYILVSLINLKKKFMKDQSNLS